MRSLHLIADIIHLLYQIQSLLNITRYCYCDVLSVLKYLYTDLQLASLHDQRTFPR